MSPMNNQIIGPVNLLAEDWSMHRSHEKFGSLAGINEGKLGIVAQYGHVYNSPLLFKHLTSVGVIPTQLPWYVPPKTILTLLVIKNHKPVILRLSTGTPELL